MPISYTLVRNEISNQYEFDLGNEKAILKYIPDGSVLTLVHTGVPEDRENQGIAHDLVQQSLDDIRQRQEKIIPLCPFVTSFIERNPQYEDLIL